MAYPEQVEIDYSYAGFAQGLGDGSFPGSQVDADLAELETGVNNLNAFIRRVVRSDEQLQNGIVTSESLSPDVRAVFNSTFVGRGAWVTATEYAVGNVVSTTSNTRAYLCLEAHTSAALFATDLAAGKWLLWAAEGVAASASPFTPYGTIAATDVQSAIEELEDEKQPLDAALTAFSGLTAAADRVPYFTASSATMDLATLTTFGRSLIDDADATAARTTLGLGSLATLSAVPDGSITFGKVADGAVVQEVGTQTGAVASGTTLMVLDDTIPQSGEGVEFLTQAITPKANSHVLEIEVTLSLAGSTAGGTFVAAIFQDSTADALAAVAQKFAGAGDSHTVRFTHRMTAGTTSATTFKVRAGLVSAGTITLNGAAAARLLGGVIVSSLIIREIKA